jgi:predicted GIY-YIG superfamily endonuclease
MTGLPERTALYRIRGEADLLLYIGITDGLPVRWNAHERKQPWWGELRSLTVELHDSRSEAKAAETAAIKAEKPKYNKIHNKQAAQSAPRPARDTRRRIAAGRQVQPHAARNCMYLDELRALPPRVDLVDAGRAWGVGRTKSYQLAQAGRFPCKVQRYGREYAVNKQDLLASLGVADVSASAA